MKKEKISGIYKIINKINGKYYVGSSNNMIGYQSRNYQHFYDLSKNRHFNNHLQSSWNKHGEENFEFVIIERDIPENQLLIIEQKYLDIAKTEKEKCYNQSFVAGRCEMTNEVKKKISKTMTGSGNPNYGKTHSDDTKQKMKNAWNKRKARGYLNPHDSKVYKFLNIKTKELFTGMRCELCKNFNLNAGSISRIINKTRKILKGWILVDCE